MTHVMDFIEIEQINPTQTVSIIDENVDFKNNEIGKIIAHNKKYNSDCYHKLLLDACNEIIINCKNVLDNCEETTLDLTGGLDSRAVYAAVSNINGFKKKTKINTVGDAEKSKDVRVAIGINSFYQLPYRQGGSRIIEESFVSENYWRSQFMGQIYSTNYNPYINEKLEIKLSGGNGDAFGRPYYSMHLFNTIAEKITDSKDMAEYIWDRQVINNVIGNYQDAKKQFVERLSEELDSFNNISLLESVDLIYYYYRNNFHFNPELEYSHGTMIFMPMQSISLFKTYHYTHDAFKNNREEIDLIITLNPLIGAQEYEMEDVNKDLNSIIISHPLFLGCLRDVSSDVKSVIIKQAEISKNKTINKRIDSRNNSQLIIRLINNVSVLERLENNYFSDIVPGILMYILNNVNDWSKLKIINNKIQSVIDELMIVNSNINSFMLGMDNIYYYESEKQLQQLLKINNEMNRSENNN